MPKREKLNKHNFSTWCPEIRSVLAKQHLLCMIDGDEDTVKNLLTKSEGRKNDAIAKAIISSEVDKSIYGELSDQYDTARDMWQFIVRKSSYFMSEVLDCSASRDDLIEQILEDIKKCSEMCKSENDKLVCQLCDRDTHGAQNCWKLRYQVMSEEKKKKIKNKPIRQPISCSIS